MKQLYFTTKNCRVNAQGRLTDLTRTEPETGNYRLIKQLFFSFTLLIIMQGMAWGQTTLAHFGLNGNLIADNVNAVGTPSATQTGLTSSSSTTPCEGSSHYYANGSGDILDITINTTGFTSITISWKQKKSDSGGDGRWYLYGDSANDGTFEYSKLDNPVVVTNDCTAKTVTLDNSFNDKSAIKLRFQSNVTSGSYLILDDISITGTVLVIPGQIKFTSSGTFTVPAGVSSVTVQAWGGGGKGGTRSSNGVSGGGGGGAYSSSTVSVTPGNYTVTVGAGSTTTSAGGDSWFGSTSTVMAKGGNSVANNSTTGANGGSASSSVQTVINSSLQA